MKFSFLCSWRCQSKSYNILFLKQDCWLVSSTTTPIPQDQQKLNLIYWSLLNALPTVTMKLMFNPTVNLLSIIVLLTRFNFVYNYYCDHDACGSHQYCCGENICCLYYNYYWTYYLWMTLVLMIIIISFCWATFHLYYEEDRYMINQTWITKTIGKVLEKLRPPPSTTILTSTLLRPESSNCLETI